MAVRDPGGCRRQSGPQKSNAVPELPAAPAVQPVMRRWPHPVAVHPAPEGLAAELHYISCALSQQTRQLDEIRCLLKRLANSAFFGALPSIGHQALAKRWRNGRP